MPFFAADVAGAGPHESMVIDAAADGYPYARLGELPPGDYWVQALVHVYTQYRRQDGHVVWAPQDQWEGQRWAFSPGNLVSAPRRVRVDPASDTPIRLELAEAIPPVEAPPDTEWVRRVKIRSRILSEWWGHPMYLGAVVLLPRGYGDNPDLRYPVVFEADHFRLDPAFGFTTEPPSDEPGLFAWMLREAGGMRESGYDFQRAWTGDDFPRVIAVTIQHPTPFFDDSYGVNSANNGPYGDAIHQELIPYLEENFRMIGEPYARVLTGGSTGGWISLAWQVRHPTFYGGTWAFYPDSVDFRRYQLIDIYEDESAFLVPGAAPGAPERMFQRTIEGQPVGSVRQLSRLERAQGSRGRSGGQIDAWNAAFGPVGEDGYPRRLWDLETGVIDRAVAHYMRDNGYDLRHYLEANWSRIGPDLVGKIRVYNPEMDQFYLTYAVYLLEEFLEGTTGPPLRRRSRPRPPHEGPPLVALHQRPPRAADGRPRGPKRSCRRIDGVARRGRLTVVVERCLVRVEGPRRRSEAGPARGPGRAGIRSASACHIRPTSARMKAEADRHRLGVTLGRAPAGLPPELVDLLVGQSRNRNPCRRSVLPRSRSASRAPTPGRPGAGRPVFTPRSRSSPLSRP